MLKSYAILVIESVNHWVEIQ